MLDLIACRYIDRERLGYGPKITENSDFIPGPEKYLSCTQTSLPLVCNGEKFELTKEVYSLNRPNSDVYPKREIRVDYMLSWPSPSSPQKSS